MEFTIETLPKYRIAYMEQIGAYTSNNYLLMEKLKVWSKENNLLNNSSIVLGIPWDNQIITPPENCRYHVCIVVDENYFFKDTRVKENRLDGGKYAVYKILHTKEEIIKAWSNIFSAKEIKKYKFDKSKPIIERYSGKLLLDNYCEICIPII